MNGKFNTLNGLLKLRKLYFTALFFLAFNNSFCQNIPDNFIISVSDDVYHFRFQSADSALRIHGNTQKNDYLFSLLSANYYWWQIITGHDSSQTREGYYKHLNRSLSLLSIPKKSAYSNDSLYALITTFAYQARIHAMNNEYFSALKQLNNCIDFVKQSFGKENEYEWFLLSSGLYDYYMESVKKNYPFLKPSLLFLPNGNTEAGIKLLERASSSENTLLWTEANYFLMKIYLEEEKLYSMAQLYATRLVQQYPENLLYRYYLFKILLEIGNKNAAIKELAALNFYSDKNAGLSEKQKHHFNDFARKDLQEYYRKNEKGGRK